MTDEEKEALKKLLGTRKLTRAKIVARLKQIGIEEDELKILYPKDDDLFKFYLNEVRTQHEVVMPDDASEGEAPTAKVKLNKEQKLAVKEIKLQAERAERVRLAKAAKTGNKAANEDEARKQFEQAGSHLPANERVSYDDMLKSLREGLQVDKNDLVD